MADPVNRIVPSSVAMTAPLGGEGNGKRNHKKRPALKGYHRMKRSRRMEPVPLNPGERTLTRENSSMLVFE